MQRLCPDDAHHNLSNYAFGVGESDLLESLSSSAALLAFSFSLLISSLALPSGSLKLLMRTYFR